MKLFGKIHYMLIFSREKSKYVYSEQENKKTCYSY